MTTAEIISILLSRKREAKVAALETIDDDSQYYANTGYMQAIDEAVDLLLKDKPVFNGLFVILEDNGTYALIVNTSGKTPTPFIVAYKVDYEAQSWAHGAYFRSLNKALREYRRTPQLTEDARKAFTEKTDEEPED